jgi:hypothetical protein
LEDIEELTLVCMLLDDEYSQQRRVGGKPPSVLNALITEDASQFLITEDASQLLVTET